MKRKTMKICPKPEIDTISIQVIFRRPDGSKVVDETTYNAPGRVWHHQGGDHNIGECSLLAAISDALDDAEIRSKNSHE